MTKAEYLAELDSHLITLPKEERDMAVAFYEEYFEDAGEENEQAVIDELGKPFNLARSIIGETSAYNKSEVYIKYRESKPMPQNSTGVFASLKKPGAFPEAEAAAAIPGNTNIPTEPDAKPEEQEEDIMPEGMPKRDNSGFTYEQDATPKFENKAGQDYDKSGMFDQYYTHGNTENTAKTYTPYKPPKSSKSAGWIIFWILMAIFVIIPIVIPTVFGILAAMLAVGFASIVCIIVSVIAVISGIIQLFTSIPMAIALAALGILVAGVGLILMSASLAFFFKLLPWCVKGIVRFSKRRFEQ